MLAQVLEGDSSYADKLARFEEVSTGLSENRKLMGPFHAHVCTYVRAYIHACACACVRASERASMCACVRLSEMDASVLLGYRWFVPGKGLKELQRAINVHHKTMAEFTDLRFTVGQVAQWGMAHKTYALHPWAIGPHGCYHAQHAAHHTPQAGWAGGLMGPIGPHTIGLRPWPIAQNP